MAQLVACPECKKHLQVPDELVGKKVQCPECKHTFTAAAEPDPEPISTSTTSVPVPIKTKKPAWDTPDKKDDDEDDYDAKKKKTRRRDRDDDEDDDRPRRRRRSTSRGDLAPHRGGLILAFGLIGLLAGIVPLAIIAWIMGNGDLAEMREGRMDPEGESMTQVGRILGMISTILTIVGVVIGCGIVGFYFICMMMFFGAVIGGANQNFPPPQPPRRF